MKATGTLPLLLLASAGIGSLNAQFATPKPEVRRALPVTPAATPSPVPVMKALPVERFGTPYPAAASVATPRPVTSQAQPAPPLAPVAIPTTTPTAPSGIALTPPASPSPLLPAKPLPSTTPAPDAAGSIRIAPVQAADPATLAASQLAVADGFYGLKQPAAAVPEYEKFMIMAPKNAEGREKALYRLGEAQRQMGSAPAAEATFLRLLSEYPSGQFAPSSSFRLGELREARGNYPNAADNFALTAKNAGDPAIRLAATYHQALCLEKSGRATEAEPLFQSLLEEPPSTGNVKTPTQAENPYRIPTLLHLASKALAAGDKEKALGYDNLILAATGDGETFGETAMKAAQLQAELGRPQEARKLFEKVIASKDAGRWKAVASLGALRLAAQSGEDNAVLKISEAALAADSENKPEILLLRANALRKKGQNAKALEAYDMILREYPRSTAAAQAPFQRLLAMHAARNPGLLTEIDQYLLTASDPGDRARAQLLKAEETLRQGKYADAALLYHGINAESLPSSAKPDILYKAAWSLLQAGDQPNGISALTRFLETYPDEERAPAALAQRALLKQQQKDFEGALSDFTLLSERYPKSSERELALQQKALLLGQLQRNSEMVATFTQLLADYPKSTAAPQAHYWIGVTALDEKDHAKALPELTLARSGDPKQFGERAGLRILLCNFHLGNAAEAAREAAALKPGLIPPEIGRWLGQKSLETGDNAKAEHFLAPLVKEGLPGASDPELQGMLATSLAAQGKYREAQAPAAACLKMARDPASRARALLVTADIQRSMRNLQEATTMAEEAMLLQPEGAINAEARLLCGDILAAKQDHTAAAKAYMTVALLNDDDVLARKALTRAAEAYRKAGNAAEAQKTLEELRNRGAHVPVSATPKP